MEPESESSRSLEILTVRWEEFGEGRRRALEVFLFFAAGLLADARDDGFFDREEFFEDWDMQR